MRSVSMCLTLTFLCALVASTALAAAPPAPVGLWEFSDTAHLTKATVGSDLTFADLSSWSSAYAGTQTAAAGVDGTDGAVTVSTWGYYKVSLNNAVPANGGGTFVNEWTILMDVKFAALPTADEGYFALFQLQPYFLMGGGNDAEFFLKKDGTLGVGATGYAGAIAPNTWYRVVISADLGTAYKVYINGTLVNTAATIPTVDGRFAILPPGGATLVDSKAGSHAITEQMFYLFADEYGEEGPVTTSTAAFYNVALTDDQVAALGVAGAEVPLGTSEGEAEGEGEAEPSNEIVSSITPGFIVPGRQLTLTAPAGDGTSYEWRYEGAPMSDTTRITGTHSRVLVFDPVSADDEGTYTCAYENGLAKTVVETLPFELTTVSAVPIAGIAGMGLLALTCLGAGARFVARKKK
jgi:hypothetical protein